MSADGFDAWMASQGGPTTTLIDGYEVVDDEATGPLSGTEILERLDLAGDEPADLTR